MQYDVKEKTYKIDCYIHEIRIVVANGEEEALQKAENDDFESSECYGVESKVIESW